MRRNGEIGGGLERGWFRTSKRWSPVYPTYGAFWGLGIGLGCGIGWGPGFGPDVVGYSGAGCGLGFSVGVTLIGFGVGVPASGLTCLPYNLLSWTRKEARKRATSHVIPTLIFGSQQCWKAWGFHSNAIKRDLQYFFERVCLPRNRNLWNNMQTRFFRRFQKINAMKPSRGLSYRFETKVLRGLHEVSEDMASKGIAEPHDKQEIPDPISLEYVGEPQERCGQVVRFSKISKRSKAFRYCPMRRVGACVVRPGDRIRKIPPCQRSLTKKAI